MHDPSNLRRNRYCARCLSTPDRLRTPFVAALLAVSLAWAHPSPAAPQDAFAGPRATFMAARDVLLAHIDAAKANSDDAYDIVSRLAAATERLASEPDDDPRIVADETVHAELDLAWAKAVTTGVCPRPAAVGPSETCFRSSIDKTLQPLAIYVPASLVKGVFAPAVVALRGRGSTESELLSLSDLRGLADRTHAILIAPYARGEATYDRAATQDVIDGLDAFSAFAAIDPKRTYIAGFSMGGIAAFHVAGYAPTRFDGLLSIVGALSPADRESIRAFDRPAYVVNAERDTLIPADRGRESVAYLRASGRSARYYEQKGGVHSFHSVLPAVSAAWDDMFAGITAPAPLEDESPQPFHVPAGTATQIPLQGRPS